LGWQSAVALVSAMNLVLAVQRSRRFGAAYSSSDAIVRLVRFSFVTLSESLR
jgi:hypothetical protein